MTPWEAVSMTINIVKQPGGWCCKMSATGWRNTADGLRLDAVHAIFDQVPAYFAGNCRHSKGSCLVKAGFMLLQKR